MLSEYAKQLLVASAISDKIKNSRRSWRKNKLS